MQNPWKLATLVLAGALLVSNARAESDWKQDALSHLNKAAELLSVHGGSKTGKIGTRDKDASPASKALQLTRAAIVQLERAGS